MADIIQFFREKISGKKSSRLGVDIGTTSIKLAEVDNIEKRPRLLGYGMLENRGSVERQNTALQTSALKLFEDEAADFLKTLIEKVSPKSRVAVAAVPSFSSFTTLLNFPQMSKEDRDKSMIYQARQHIPMDLSEVVLDWAEVGEYEDESGLKYTQSLLTAVPKNLVDRYKNIASKAGLTLSAIEVEAIGLSRILTKNDPTPTFIVDIGARSTGIFISEGGSLKFVTQTDFSGGSITTSIARGLNINPVRAEELKKERGVIGTGTNRELSTIILPILDGIISEVRRADYSYHGQFPLAPKAERMILVGGGANLLGARKYFQDQMKIPVVRAAPFVRFEYPSALEPLVPELNSTLALSLALATRGE